MEVAAGNESIHFFLSRLDASPFTRVLDGVLPLIIIIFASCIATLAASNTAFQHIHDTRLYIDADINDSIHLRFRRSRILSTAITIRIISAGIGIAVSLMAEVA